jgi:hypothetical protein
VNLRVLIAGPLSDLALDPAGHIFHLTFNPILIHDSPLL